MRSAQPYNKFYTNDFLVDENEMTNAFWGLHLANNMEHVIGVDGYAYFPKSAQFERSAQIPLSRLELQMAPAVQMFACLDEVSGHSATTLVTKQTAMQGELMTPITSDPGLIGGANPMFWARIYMHNFTAPNVGDVVRFGLVNDELFRVLMRNQVGYDQTMGVLFWDLYLQRGLTQFTGYDSYTGDGSERVYTVSDYSATTLNFKNETFTLNPAWVEAQLCRDYVRFLWMHDSSGTLYFKIYGV